ncbi:MULTISPECIES: YhcG family protein [unclassified Adlercreutzia]|uniref:PDDEXK nuclease domain-containing protein n=1 Tax=unclassified Adlercreutzia TaxID=2636013 RepID=UPI001F14AC83|nr:MULTISPECIES: PDDEXK nuclease domain-containing protein [unclassified Adlercreutzia]
MMEPGNKQGASLLGQNALEHVDLDGLYSQVREILEAARVRTYRAVNFEMVKAYWEVGKSIVEAQGGEERSEYGKRILSDLAARLTKDFGKGFTQTNLKYMRQFYLAFQNSHALRDQLSWTHYRLLIKVKDADKRLWYMNECAESNWTTRQLERQINSFYYERLLATQEERRPEVIVEVFENEPPKRPENIIRDPYVLEFLGINQDAQFRESELEQALINNLQEFLLELGRGFAFVARQKHIDLDGDHFYIDLVFYNYLLNCFVLIDLKVGKLTHQDIGQMDTYVRLYNEFQRGPNDNPTIGIVLCSEKNEAVARYSLLADDKNVFASKYETTIPKPEELEAYIQEERRRFEERQQDE